MSVLGVIGRMLALIVAMFLFVPGGYFLFVGVGGRAGNIAMWGIGSLVLAGVLVWAAFKGIPKQPQSPPPPPRWPPNFSGPQD